MPKLTKRVVEGIKSGAKDIFVWDNELPGYGLRVKPSGIRSYVAQYRNAQGRSRRLTIGRHGVLTADEARAEARQVLALAERGKDPAAERQASLRAPTVSELCDRYLTEHVAVHNRPSTQEEFRRIVEKQIRPALGTLKAEGVTRVDVTKLHRSMGDTPRQANHTLSVLSKMFSLAEIWGLRPDGSNPCRRIKRYPEVTRERFLSEEELSGLGEALDQAEREQTEMPGVILAIRLLALTGCRLGEILGLKWEHVDFEGGVFRLPDAKAGARIHSVGALVLALLADIPRSKDRPWVVHGKLADQPLSKGRLEIAWRRLRKKATVKLWEKDEAALALIGRLREGRKRESAIGEIEAAAKRENIALSGGLKDVRMHDLRHTVGTYAGQAGANAFLVRDKLGHKTLAMTGRYVNRDADPLRELSDRVESRIEAAMRGSDAEGGTVVPLRPGNG